MCFVYVSSSVLFVSCVLFVHRDEYLSHCVRLSLGFLTIRITTIGSHSVDTHHLHYTHTFTAFRFSALVNECPNHSSQHTHTHAENNSNHFTRLDSSSRVFSFSDVDQSVLWVDFHFWLISFWVLMTNIQPRPEPVNSVTRSMKQCNLWHFVPHPVSVRYRLSCSCVFVKKHLS